MPISCCGCGCGCGRNDDDGCNSLVPEGCCIADGGGCSVAFDRCIVARGPLGDASTRCSVFFSVCGEEACVRCSVLLPFSAGVPVGDA